MKSPFKKLRFLTASIHGFKHRTSGASCEPEEFQDVARGIKEVEETHILYEALVTNANIICGSAFDFSRSLQEMASHMAEALGQIVDKEIGDVFSMLAKVQLEISKLLDLFAAHVSQAIIAPTEVLLREIQQVQVMKEHYDEKWQAYSFLRAGKQKGRPKNVKRDVNEEITSKDAFVECAKSFHTMLQAVIQGRSHNLITQAARYHSAQVHLFSKGLGSVNAMEPVMRRIALERNINRTRSENNVRSFSMLDCTMISSKSNGKSTCTAGNSLFNNGGESRMESASNSISLSLPIQHHKDGPLLHDSSLENHGNGVSMYALPSPMEASESFSDFASKQARTISPKPGKGFQSSGDAKSGRMLHNVKKQQMDRAFVEISNDDNSFDTTPKFGRVHSHSGLTAESIFGSSKQVKSKNSHSSLLLKSGSVSNLPLTFTSHSMSVPFSSLHKLPSPSHITYLAHLGSKVDVSKLSLSSSPSPLPPPSPLTSIVT